MKDDAMERVLAGLGKVEAPNGLEGRVLRRLAEGGTARPRRGWVLGTGLAIAAVLCGAWMVEWEFVTLPQTVKLSEMGVPGTLGRRQDVLQGLKPGPVTVDRTAEVVSLAKRRTRRKQGSAEVPVSYPAPSAPLTEEERMLRQIALTRNQPAFELLNEATREAALAASEADFNEFLRSSPFGGGH